MIEFPKEKILALVLKNPSSTTYKRDENEEEKGLSQWVAMDPAAYIHHTRKWHHNN